MDSLENWLEIIGKSLSLVIMIVSWAGLIVPIFPGILIIWVVALVFGIVSGFGTLGTIMFVVISVLAVAGLLADNVLMGAKAKENGASWASILLALGGGILFTMIFPPIGGIIAAPLILYGMERSRQGGHDGAMKTVKALVIGWGWAVVARLIIGGLMIILWWIWAVFV